MIKYGRVQAIVLHTRFVQFHMRLAGCSAFLVSFRVQYIHINWNGKLAFMCAVNRFLSHGHREAVYYGVQIKLGRTGQIWWVDAASSFQFKYMSNITSYK